MHGYSLKIKKIIYEDPETRFYIFTGEDLDDPSANDRKVKGNFHAVEPRPGLEMKVYGEWENSQYGYTLTCHESEILFISEEGIRNYLISAAGMETLDAFKVVDEFGEDALEMMRQDDDRLYDLSFLTDEQVRDHASQLDFTESYSDAIKELIAFGIPSDLVEDAYLAVEGGDIEKLKENPYLLMKVDDLSFKRIDQVAIRSGKETDGRDRLAAAVEYLLRRAETRGHLYLEISSISWKLKNLPDEIEIPSYGRYLDKEDIKDAVRDLNDRNSIIMDGSKVYLTHNFQIEHDSAEKLSRMIGSSYDLGIDTDEFIDNYEDVHKIDFSDEQKEAIRALNNNKVFLLTGLPGTGKTVVSKALVRLFQKADKDFDLVCPTGIAAKKLGTVVGEEAKTIHRLLGYDGWDWDYDQTKQYQTDAVIVDEASMLDQDLLYRLVTSLKDDTALVFVGDYAQLPAVGAGNVLMELVDCGSIKQVNLTRIFRQNRTSDIVLNAHKINQGEELIYNDPKDSDTDFRFIEEDDPDRIVSGVISLVDNLYQSPEEHTFQVLSPTYKTVLGVDNLNREIKSVINPSDSKKLERRLGGKSFREDDRIMITENDYNKEVFNGEQGKIRWIKEKKDRIRTKIFAKDGSKTVDFSFGEAKDMLVLSYAMTCHKSQGQEWDYVIFPFHEKFSFQLQRNLLYTAVTRAKQKVFIIGQKSAIRSAVDNDRVDHRNTIFAERLSDILS